MNLNTLSADPRRRFKRFELHIQAYVSWKSGDGKKRRAAGITRDLSTHGAFISVANCPEERSLATVEFLLGPASARRRMRMRGRVIRTELLSPPQTYGFAIRAHRQLSIVGDREKLRRENRNDCPAPPLVPGQKQPAARRVS